MAGPHNKKIIGEPHTKDSDKDEEQDLADARAFDPCPREAHCKTGLWRLVGEALLAQRLDALLENLVGTLIP